MRCSVPASPAFGYWWYAGIEGRSPRRAVSGAPTNTYGIDLNGGICAAIFVEAGKRHQGTVAQIGNRGVPASVGHVLNIGELACRRIIDRVAQLSVKRIILNRAAINERLAVGKNDHSVAKHVPVHSLGRNRLGHGVENSSSQVGVCGEIARSGDDQHFPVMEKSGVDRIDGHRTLERLPLALQVGLSSRVRDVKQAEYAHGRYDCQRPCVTR
jgi:hypothetical protein